MASREYTRRYPKPSLRGFDKVPELRIGRDAALHRELLVRYDGTATATLMS